MEISSAIPRITAARRRWPMLEEVILAAFLLGAAIFAAYEYNIFSDAPDKSVHEHAIDLGEALILAQIMLGGLLLLCWRVVFLQRREVARRIEAESHAHRLAHQDALTGLPNRRQFDEALKAILSKRSRATELHAVLLLDLNDFKRVNDVYGHGAGDDVLIHVAKRLQHAIRQQDLVARFGGDEFAILAHLGTGEDDAKALALRVIHELDQPITVGSIQHQIGVAIGITLLAQNGGDAPEIMRKADIALYRAKAEPGSALCIFEAGMDAHVRERDLIEREFRTALKQGTIQPHYQPLMNLQTADIAGFEALARWKHPELGNVPPDRFIPIAESCGLMSELTDHLLRQAAQAACQWPNDMTLAFNISASQLKDRTLGLRILSILGEAGLPPYRLEIEITESALVQDLEGAQQVVGALREAGVRVALDDFGTGYSNLYHLRNFKIDRIKIDRSFIDKMEEDAEASALIRGLMGLSQGLGLNVTVEGIELPSQAAALLAQGCQQGQGYLFGRAMPAADALAYIARHEPNMAAHK
jgi:diguanylate cyclase (GGDEF)-like protein